MEGGGTRGAVLVVGGRDARREETLSLIILQSQVNYIYFTKRLLCLVSALASVWLMPGPCLCQRLPTDSRESTVSHQLMQENAIFLAGRS